MGMIAETMTLTHDNLHGDEPITIEAFRNEAMVALSAGGVGVEKIAEVVGVSVERAEVFLNQDRTRIRVSRMREELFGSDPRARATVSAAAAWKVIDDLMSNNATKDSVRLAAAQATLDRAYGKATQTVEVGGSLLRALIEKMDQRQLAGGESRERQVIDVGAEPKSLPAGRSRVTAPASPKAAMIDGWVSKNF